jgi:predicted AAA+ superfamily ATPase
MITRPLWLARIERAWKQAPVTWLAGVRRAGKTVLAGSLKDTEFINCDLPGGAARLQDPEAFFRSVRQPRIVLDEVHQLPDPSRLLKIAADAFPRLRVLATGSSTLAATRKFRDSLTGRKRTIRLTPVLVEELPAFGVTSMEERLLRGGLPPALLANNYSWEFYAEWLDSYFARDVQELFHVEKRAVFLRLVELVFRQSGGLLEITSLAKHTGASRPTIMNWLDVLQVTQVAHLIRPFAEGGRRELLAQPKLYAFDTGFICHTRGWDKLRPDDCGPLWENLVLDTLLAIPVSRLHFWRDKSQREVDFVVPFSRDRVDAIECKWNPATFAVEGIAAFRANYPQGRNFVVCPNLTKSYTRRMKNLTIEFTSPPLLALDNPSVIPSSD